MQKMNETSAVTDESVLPVHDSKEASRVYELAEEKVAMHDFSGPPQQGGQLSFSQHDTLH